MSVFDQLKKIASASGAQAAPGRETIPFTDRLEQSAGNASRRAENLYQALGKAYYEAHADDRQTEYEEQLAAIRSVCGEIARYEEQAAEIAARRRCPS